MAAIANDTIAVFGKGVLQAEGVVIDKEGNAWGGGRNGKVVTPQHLTRRRVSFA
jgi:hypothetical protein